MFRVSLLLLLGLSVGAVTGWWARGHIVEVVPPQSALTTGTPITNTSIEVQPTSLASELQNGVTTTTVADTVSESLIQSTQVTPSTPAPVLDPINLDSFVDRCGQLDNVQLSQCRQQVIQSRNRDDIDLSQVRFLMQQWMSVYPDDIGIGLQYAQVIFDQGDYIAMLDYLETLQLQSQTESNSQRIEQTRFQLGQMALKLLSGSEDKLAMLPLLERLMGFVPDHAPWRYGLAQLQFQAGKMQPALDNLGYILYDELYAERAQTLYDKINERLSLANYSEIPLTRKGNHFLVKALIAGSTEMTLLVDTGASITTIDKSSLRRSGLLKAGTHITLNTAGGRVNSTLQPLSSLSLGNQTVFNLQVATLDHSQNQVDGLLGMDYLGQFDFILDQNQQKLLLSPKR